MLDCVHATQEPGAVCVLPAVLHRTEAASHVIAGEYRLHDTAVACQSGGRRIAVRERGIRARLQEAKRTSTL